jgi:hypothetical protein
MAVHPHEAINWFVNGELDFVKDGFLDWTPITYDVAQDLKRTLLHERRRREVHHGDRHDGG